MSTNVVHMTETWLAALSGPESKKHETAAHEIIKTPTYDAEIIAALKRIARDDPQKYAREAAKNALRKIADTHFAAGNDIRKYLEELRVVQIKKPTERELPPLPLEPLYTAPPEPVQPAAPNTAAVTTKPVAAAPISPVAAIEHRAEPKPIAPPKPQVPFDQWLLSERNIKLALYSGGLLLLLAGLIFVGVNWNYLPGVAKLGVTFAVTAALYAGGVLLFKRPALQIGGTALLVIASGFLPLNFVVTQLYLLQGDWRTANLLWLVASAACGAAYLATALWTRRNLFTVFALVACVSGATAMMRLSSLPPAAMIFGYALVALAVMVAGHAAKGRDETRFMTKVLRVAAHVSLPLLFVVACAVWLSAMVNWMNRGEGWFALAAMFTIAVTYAVDDWRAHLLYACWGAAVVFGVWMMFTCTQLEWSAIQTGIALKLVAAAYLIVGYRFQRGKMLRAGVPFYTVGGLLALFVTFQSFLVYAKTPEHFALALAGDVALLGLATYLSRRVEFLFAAVWLAMAPVYLFAQIFISDMMWRGLAMGALMLVYAAVGFRRAEKQRVWAMPFLTASAFLSAGVPYMLYPNFGVLTIVLALTALGYVVMAIRLQQPGLLLAMMVFADAACISGAKIFMPWDWNLMRVFAFMAAANALLWYFAEREMRYLRLFEWNMPFAIGAYVNFGLTACVLCAIGFNDVAMAGTISIQLVSTLSWGVVLLLALAYLYRRVLFLYGATWLAMASMYLAARLYLQDAVTVGWAMGALLLAYAGAGYFIGRKRLVWGGAFLSAAIALSVLVPMLLMPQYGMVMLALLAIAALYAFFAVWLRWPWLTLAALAALNAAVFAGIAYAFTLRLDVERAAVVVYAALGLLLVAGGVELKRRGFMHWRVPLYLVAVLDLVGAYVLSLNAGNLFVVILSPVVAVVALAMQWVERAEFEKNKMPPLLTYGALLVLLNGVHFAAQMLTLAPVQELVAMAGVGAVYVGVALVLRERVGAALYGAPLRFVGLGAVGVTMLATLYFHVPMYAALTFAVGAIAFGADGFVRKQIALLYAGGAMLVTAWSFWMMALKVEELQAYAMALGLYGLAVGWSEMRAGRYMTFQFATIAGLLVLFGSAFYQSLSNVNYAALLLVESVLAFLYGMKMHSRIFVEAAILGLLANGLAQFGPAFVNLERWVQIGTIGSVLLLSGLVALFRRQKLLEARRSFTNEWKMWKP